MVDWIDRAGKIAGSISTLVALLTLVLWKPVKGYAAKKKEQRRAEKMDASNFRDEVREMLKEIKRDLSALVEDVAELQCDRLGQAYDIWKTERGWCPADTKRRLCLMFKSYHNKGRNHLSENYESDIMGLPDSPAHMASQGRKVEGSI